MAQESVPLPNAVMRNPRTAKMFTSEWICGGTFFCCLLTSFPFSVRASADELEVQGVHVVPHVQSAEMKYAKEPDFRLGARVEVFLRNKSAKTLTLPASTSIRVRDKTPEQLISDDQWAWHDLPSAWEGQALQLPPGAMTVWSWNGKRDDWGMGTQAELSIALPEAIGPNRMRVSIDKPSVWLSAVTFLGSADVLQPDSLLIHLANASNESLRIDGCRLWLPDSNRTFRSLIPQPWIIGMQERFPSDGVIPARDRGGVRISTGPLPLTYAAIELRLLNSAGKPFSVWAHQRIKREAFDISGGWVHDTSGGGHKPLESEVVHRMLRRIHINTAHIGDMPGYTDQNGPDGIYTRYPLKYFSHLTPPEKYDTDAILPRVHAVELLGEPQYGGGKPVPPQDCWKALSIFGPTRLPTSITHSEERVWRFYAGISDYPHYDAYRVTAPSADSWARYDRWNGRRILWGSPLETIGEMSRSLRELNRPRPVAYWSQGPHFDWEGYGGRKRGSPTPDELRLQAYHALSNRITSLYWFNLSLRSLATFPDLIEPMVRVGREIRMLEEYYLEGDATSHEPVVRDGEPDWDLDVVAGPRGGVLFALDLAYEADPDKREFVFGPPRDSVFRFPLPAYLHKPAEVFRVDADGTAPVPYTIQKGAIEIRDRASRVAIYVVSLQPGESQRLEARRQALIACEESFGFAPDRNPNDLAVLKQLAEVKQP